ncbi:hypothetical protein ROZALSC1DRAFT_23346 [Rozella allomycis CSF55]|uniref:Outer arm dynein light chain 1 n=1 Tax=Rozella allomycis (strain CSF55) TaxID=988480 RepID=A0A4P9YIZ9_ROZAC|nr:hypothetical protein ROZALSC1DRAFT_23346 [Rozella allomycis CSF55]
MNRNVSKNYIENLELETPLVNLKVLNVDDQRNKMHFQLRDELTPSIEVIHARRCEINAIPAGFPSLQTIDLSGNNIEDIEEFLKQSTQIQAISLKDNPITKKPRYRNQIISYSKSLQYIDDRLVTELERVCIDHMDKVQKHTT